VQTPRRLPAALLLLALLGAGPAAAQGPSADWRTLETAHYRFHFPAASEAWTRRAAARVEAVRERVAAEVGYQPPQKVDVLVVDPLASANGAALPFLGRPRLVLFTTPPPPDSTIGNYRDWVELLLVHEQAHLAHLLRPSRNPLARRLAWLLPVGPVALAAPRWVTEGYATVVEGRLTGSGRPFGDLRAAVLRRRALAGKLPSYRALDRDDESWQGGSMAYLAGSAFLEWLEQRAGPESLPKLWRRMTARETRSFDDAFRGVFGEAPGDLYGRFAAELTHSALEAERRLAAAAPERREGEPWLDRDWGTGAPALTPAGDLLAAVRGRRDEPGELVVWATAIDEEAESKRQERIDRLLRRDPEDVAPVRSGPPPRKQLHELALDPQPAMPRFLPGGEEVLFVRFAPDAEGFLHPDLFRWRPEDGSVERLTHGADVRDPDPGPDGRWAVATRIRHGLSQIVRVDLETGAIEPVTEPGFDPVDRPRVAPDGRRVAFARHVSAPPEADAPDVILSDCEEMEASRPQILRCAQDDCRGFLALLTSDVILSAAKDLGGGESGTASSPRMGQWELVVRDLATGAETRLAPPPGGSAWSPAWSADGRTLFASVGLDGFIDLWAFPVDPPGPPVRLTRTVGAALAPEPTPDGKALFYLSLDADGLDVYRLELPQPLSARALAPLETADLVPAVPPPPPEEVAPLALAEPGASRPYGLGRPETLLLSSGSDGSSGGSWDVGVRVGDVVGRYDLLALGGSGDAGPRGGALAGAYRGLPVELSLHAFQVEERPSRQDGALTRVDPSQSSRAQRGIWAGEGGLDAERRGVELMADWTRHGLNGRRRLSPAVFAGEIDPLGGAVLEEPGRRSLQQEIVALAADWQGRRRLGRWTFAPEARARWDAGETGDASWDRWRATAGLAVSYADTGDLGFAWTRGHASRALHPWDRFQVGGVASSLVPETVLAPRVLAPALPAGTLLGDDVESQRLVLALDALPLPLFAERHRVAAAGGGGWGEWLRVAGVEWRLATPPLPIAAIPAFDLRLGAARVLDPPFEDDDRWWIAVVLRP
jgi:hypothetical protein